ncbi:UNVERIFIED_CONTAM: hypothetical protein Sindi_2311900, partial [Sesamum indicum]
MFGDLGVGVDVDEDSEGGRKDDVNDEDEDSDLFDSDYNISTEVEDDDILFDDYVDDKTTSDLEVDDENNSDGLSGSSDDGKIDIMGDEIDLNENKVSDDEQSESSYPIFNPAEKFDPTFTLGMMFSTKADTREKPILTMLEWIREFLMKRLQENRDMAEAKWKDRICPRIRKILDKHIEKVGDCIPIKADNFHYQISCFDGGQYAVDLSNHTCSCRKWELSGIPCKHAISAILNQKDDPEDYIDDCYSVIAYKRIYASAIMPISGENQWNETCFIPPLPPRFGRRSGRPSSARRRDADEPMPKKKKGKK